MREDDRIIRAAWEGDIDALQRASTLAERTRDPKYNVAVRKGCGVLFRRLKEIADKIKDLPIGKRTVVIPKGKTVTVTLHVGRTRIRVKGAGIILLHPPTSGPHPSPVIVDDMCTGVEISVERPKDAPEDKPGEEWTVSISLGWKEAEGDIEAEVDHYSTEAKETGLF